MKEGFHSRIGKEEPEMQTGFYHVHLRDHENGESPLKKTLEVEQEGKLIKINLCDTHIGFHRHFPWIKQQKYINYAAKECALENSA